MSPAGSFATAAGSARTPVVLFLGAGVLAMFFLLALYMQVVGGFGGAYRPGLPAVHGRRRRGLRAGCRQAHLRRLHHDRHAGSRPAGQRVAAGPLNTSVQTGSALGLGALAAIASMVTRSRLEGHAVAAALTDGYVSGLLAAR